MNNNTTNPLPLVYACSGCSSAAQMANYLAVALDRAAVAEMSCIAGVGGNVSGLVRVAKSERTIIAIDGCPLACSLACLQQQGVQPQWHVVLTDWGVRKVQHADFDQGQAAAFLTFLRMNIPAMAAQRPLPAPAHSAAK